MKRHVNAAGRQFGQQCPSNLTSYPICNPIQHLWGELDQGLRARPDHPTSVLDLTNALAVEWEKNPAADHHKNACDFGMRCSAVTYGCNVQVSTHFWPYSVNQYVHQVIVNYVNN